MLLISLSERLLGYIWRATSRPTPHQEVSWYRLKAFYLLVYRNPSYVPDTKMVLLLDFSTCQWL
jgi:hypothetical protein